MKVDFYKHAYYPSSEDRKQINQQFPLLNEIRLTYDFNRAVSFDTPMSMVNSEDSDSWLRRLSSRLAQLKLAYTFTKYSYNKGIPDENWKTSQPDGKTIYFIDFSEEHHVNHYLFRYHVEYFYYLYFSTVDIMYKCIDCFFQFNVSARMASQFNKLVLSRLQEKNTCFVEILKKFEVNVKDKRAFRNLLTHDFSPLELDFRYKQEIDESKMITASPNVAYTPSKETIEALEEALTEFQVVMKVFNGVVKCN